MARAAPPSLDLLSSPRGTGVNRQDTYVRLLTPSEASRIKGGLLPAGLSAATLRSAGERPTLLGANRRPVAGDPAADAAKGNAAPNASEGATSTVCRLLVAMGKREDDQSITVRDVLTHMDAVRALVPQLLDDFSKLDRDSTGRVSASQLEAYLSPKRCGASLGQSELQEIWDRLSSSRGGDLPADCVYLQDLARHYRFLEQRLPQLLDRFHEVDTDQSCSIERSEFDAFFGDGEAWLEAKLSGVIGLESLKEQIRRFYWATRLDRMRRCAGAFVSSEEAHVLMFKGNPGVGKTTIARLVTGLLHKIGVIPTENFVEVQRDQLVGDHIGATEKATEEAIQKARGGVLFVDEAYRLNVDVFGVEAINCLMKAMSVKGNVIILAGYPEQMDDFVAVNPGIKRRVTYEFTFPDYSSKDLALIFEAQVRRRGFRLSDGADTDSIAAAVERLTTPAQRAALNGGVGEHACRHAIFHLNERQIQVVRAAADADATEEVHPSVTLELADVEFGCGQVPAAAGTTAADTTAPVTMRRDTSLYPFGTGI